MAAFLIVRNQAGVEGRHHARVVEEDRKKESTFLRTLGPGRPDLGSSGVDAMAGPCIGGLLGGDDADALDLDGEGGDLAGVFGAVGFEGADDAHGDLPFRLSPLPSRPRWRSKDRRRSKPHLAGPQRQRRTGTVGLLASRGIRNVGDEGRPEPLRQATEAKPSFGQVSPSERPVNVGLQGQSINTCDIIGSALAFLEGERISTATLTLGHDRRRQSRSFRIAWNDSAGRGR